MDRRRALFAELERCSKPDALAELARISELPFDTGAMLAAFTAIDRRAGNAPLSNTDTGIATAGELARVLVLLTAEARAPKGSFAAFFRRAFDDGDNRERIAVLRALPFLARPEDVLETAIESTRTHVVPIFEALACDNPYPAAHFPDLNFNQMALKAAFVGLSLHRIVDLERRRTPDLARMARDYAAERRAAGRSVPSDLSLLEQPS